jgi:HAD superfamily hydrolase (TIGR01509 family)
MKPGSADALLFDLGGVVIDIDFNLAFARWAHHASCDAAVLRERFSQDLAYQRHEIGAIGHEEYFESLRASLQIDIPNAHFLDGWNAIFIDEVPGMASLLAETAKRIPIYAFSNSNHMHESQWSGRFDNILSHFRTIFVSSTIGLRKPDAEAFQFVVNEIGVPAGRIVFFDDSLDNVEGARASGLQAVHVTSHADVARTRAAILRDADLRSAPQDED